MYTVPWFEEDIQAMTELHEYLLTIDKLKPATHPAEFLTQSINHSTVRHATGGLRQPGGNDSGDGDV